MWLLASKHHYHYVIWNPRIDSNNILWTSDYSFYYRLTQGLVRDSGQLHFDSSWEFEYI